MRARSLSDRFWEKVNKTDTCWLWTAADDGGRGYGLIRVNMQLPMQKAHRVAWELCVGAIPDGLCVLHKCDVVKCVNPSHLFLGTYKDNAVDCIKKGRFSFAQTGEDHPKAILNTIQVAEIKALLLAGGKHGFRTALAKKYGVSRAAISHIEAGRTWREVV